jgi:tripartite-type tricarboxylate transporter receptor subunit TctC
MFSQFFSMTQIVRRAVLIVVPTAMILAMAPCNRAQAAWPERTVRLVLPYGPGGVADVPARILAEKLSTKFGQRVVIENMPGPGGINAARTVLTAPPDGYTMGFVTNGNAIASIMFEHLPYDPVKQFTMVSQVGSFSLTFAVNAQSKYKTLDDVIKAAKANPGKLNVGTVAVGSTQNFGAELLKSMANVDLQIVPYKNSPDIVVALIRNDVDLMLDFPVAIQAQASDGKLRFLATTGSKRSTFLPDVPTAAESGVPGYEASSWNGVFAPQGTPKEVIDTMNQAIREALASPDMATKFANIGIVGQASSPEELMGRLKADVKKWEVVRVKAGIPKN